MSFFDEKYFIELKRVLNQGLGNQERRHQVIPSYCLFLSSLMSSSETDEKNL